MCPLGKVKAGEQQLERFLCYQAEPQWAENWFSVLTINTKAGWAGLGEVR